MQMYLKNKDGQRSVSLTMVVVSFGVVTGWLVLWLVLASFGLTIPAFDATTAMAYLSPILMLYFGRKNTDARAESATKNSNSNSNNRTTTQQQQTQRQQTVENEA